MADPIIPTSDQFVLTQEDETLQLLIKKMSTSSLEEAQRFSYGSVSTPNEHQRSIIKVRQHQFETEIEQQR
jgi:hypothetical protein